MFGEHCKLRKNEQGFAAILVTIVLLVVVSLITTGFAIQMRKEQQASLNNQLSTQAYYAAESGVNDYAKIIKTYIATNPAPTSVADLNTYLGALNSGSCAPSGIYSSLHPDMTANGGVKYTCVTVNAAPTQLQYGSIGGTSQIIPISSASAINKLVITWQPTVAIPTIPAGSNRTSTCPSSAGIDSFPATTSWQCPISIVRVDLVPTPLGSTYSLSSLQNSTMTAFFVPTMQGSGSGTVSYTGSGNNQYGASANQGAVVAAKCTDTAGAPAPSCTMTITGLQTIDGQPSNSFSLRLSTIYGNAAVNIQGYNNSDTSNPLELSGAQVVVDSTGLAQDVLHRIQVRIPVGASASGDTFNAAIMSAESLCKQFQTAPPAVYNPGPGGC